ncbi:MAG: hypothetical protein EU550_01255 [Promethearchaeota archaeon]|nr:MAG: hypothetical protein EU550_01255 [Candidatus Lokiarchaeota archaeon]
MAEEFANFMQETRKAPIEEKLNSFGDIVEKMMFMILKIPDLVEQSLNTINQKISTLETRINTINNDLNSLKRGGGLSKPIVATPKAPASAPPPTSGPPGGPPRGPPGGPPGGPPPPPGGSPGGPGAARPASPVSLRGAIMSELKQLFNKRKAPE